MNGRPHASAVIGMLIVATAAVSVAVLLVLLSVTG